MSPLKLDLKGLNDLFDRAQAEKDRETVFELSEIVMRNCGVKDEYGVGPIKYDVRHKLREEIDKLTPDQIGKTLSDVKALLEKREENADRPAS